MSDDPADDDRPHLPDGLLARLRADPVRAPEHLALAAAEQHGPAADAWASEQRARYGHGPHELARRATRQHVHWARLGGAVGGIGGFVTVLPDLAAAAWIQSRMVFFIAAAHDFAATDPMRPAELLVLWEVYEDVGEARAALDGTGRSVASAYIDKRLSADEALARRLVGMVARRGATRAAGRLIPGFAIFANAIGNSRETRALADRAREFYGG